MRFQVNKCVQTKTYYVKVIRFIVEKHAYLFQRELINYLLNVIKEEAFRVYKQYKESLIKETIDSYEGKIPEPYYSRLREAMYNYEVEMDD